MDLAFFVDRAGTLGSLERTPQGGYRAPATIAKVGVMVYDTAACRRQGMAVPADYTRSTVRIFTPAEVLESAKDSLGDAPVTNEHPPKMVTPTTYRKVAAGTVSAGTVRFEDGLLKGMLAIQDETLLADIESGRRREVSAGYAAATDFEAGTTAYGEEYDAVRTEILYNHAAVVTRGRAGPSVCLALDSDDIPNESETAVKIKVKGVEFDADKAQAAIDALEGELTGLSAERDSVKAELDGVKTKLAEAVSDTAISAAVEKELTSRAAKVEADKRVAAVKAAFPAVALDGKSVDFVDGLFASIPADGLAVLQGRAAPTAPATVTDAKPKTDARAAMIARNRAAAKG